MSILFSEIGPAFKRRAMHNLSHERLQTQQLGELVPCECLEVLPGDRINFKTDMVVRLSPLLAPIMSQIDVTTHYWFVPNRIIWDDWEEFITGGKDNDPTQAPVVPTISITNASVGSLADYLGVPTGLASALTVSALPFRAYAKIYNEWYRDENLQTEIGLSTASGSDSTTNTTLQMRNWNHDYFTSCLPWPQRGPAVTIPVGSDSVPVAIEGDGGFNLRGIEHFGVNSDLKTGGMVGGSGSTTQSVLVDTSGNIPVGESLKYNKGLKGTADLSSATATDIRTLRQAFQLQLWAELSARAGYRYVENTLAHFGVRIPDSRLQRPEYLGGGKSPVVVSEVLQTSSTDTTSPQGNMAGHAFSAQKSHGFTKTFVEHGFVIAIVNVQPKTMYQQGLSKMWTRDTKEAYFWPMFEHIGEEAVYNKEIYAQGDTVYDTDGNVVDNKPFGYQSRYEDYRTKPNEVHGEFKSTLNYWHTGRIFASLPVLNGAFVKSDTVDRINAVTGVDNVYLDMYHSIQALRPVGRRGNPGRIDHKW
jgi:Capsid protein (F protein).